MEQICLVLCERPTKEDVANCGKFLGYFLSAAAAPTGLFLTVSFFNRSQLRVFASLTSFIFFI